jgi:hypothetical protein
MAHALLDRRLLTAFLLWAGAALMFFYALTR